VKRETTVKKKDACQIEKDECSASLVVEGDRLEWREIGFVRL
jgi:hypothetical protein